jgi:hypothetical protein
VYENHISLEECTTLAVDSAGGLLEEIYAQLDKASADEVVLEQSWMRLGKLLLRCKNAEAWRPAGFQSFELFMLHLRDRYNRGKTQLWSYMTVAEKLSPTIDAKTLEEIGISKALELKRGLKKSGGKAIPQEIIDKARLQATTIKEVRALLAQAFNLSPDDKGTWFDLDGFFVTTEEKQEFVSAVRTTLALLGIAKDIPNHIQRKEVIFAWAREFIGTHAAEVHGPQEMQNTPATLVLPGPVPDAFN